MALLQIAEPGQSAAPHQHKRAVGIDLGTTNSLVAAVRSGHADTLCDEQGRDLLPSVVHYQVDAIKAIQKAASQGKTRYLLEMATGTGKTLTCAAIIKLFLKI